MIVVDTNVLAYLLIEGPRTGQARRLAEKAPGWRLPELWKIEFLNVLLNYWKFGGMESGEVEAVWDRSSRLDFVSEAPVSYAGAMRLARRFRVSAYDAAFLALAESLGTVCVTEDRKLRQAAPDLAVSMGDFLAAGPE